MRYVRQPFYLLTYYPYSWRPPGMTHRLLASAGLESDLLPLSFLVSAGKTGSPS